MSENRSEISQLGEFGLIDRIREKFSLVNSTSIMGIGDDAAVIEAGDECLLISTDMLVEGIHFDLSYSPIHHVGYKAIAVNVSDIAAMNGRAEQVTVSIALSNRLRLSMLYTLELRLLVRITKSTWWVAIRHLQHRVSLSQFQFWVERKKKKLPTGLAQSQMIFFA